MNRLARFSFSFAAALALTAGAAFADGATPIRHLVYKFDISLSTTATMHTSGIGGGGSSSDPKAAASSSGIVENRAGNTDQGTIAVDVQQVQPDSGLVVQISEQARNSRNGAPTECVIYGTGAVICDQTHGQLNEEESSLLRFLGRNFINPATIDAHNQWKYTASDAQSQEATTYTLGKGNGDTVPVSYERVLKVSGVSGFEATTDGNLTYDKKMSVPVQVKEDTFTRRNTGMGNYETTQQQITLTLAGDSLAQASQSH